MVQLINMITLTGISEKVGVKADTTFAVKAELKYRALIVIVFMIILIIIYLGIPLRLFEMFFTSRFLVAYDDRWYFPNWGLTMNFGQIQNSFWMCVITMTTGNIPITRALTHDAMCSWLWRCVPSNTRWPHYLHYWLHHRSCARFLTRRQSLNRS